MERREFLRNGAAVTVAAAVGALPRVVRASTGSDGAKWRTFEVVTRVEVANPTGPTRVWLPMALAVDTDYQKSLGHSWTGNGAVARVYRDDKYGAAVFYAEWPAGESAPVAEVTSRFAARDRLVDVTKPGMNASPEDRATLQRYRESSKLVRTDGIVKKTSQQITKGADKDVDKARAIYEWIVENTFRDPKVRGCGVGDIRAMLETGNLGGKCADLNAIFVGLCRAAGLPARDVYGLRLVPSAFGYKELSGNPASLKGAQHCRAEVFLKGYGWVAMDPADVAKVMRLETTEWIKTTDNPVVAPVNKALFGGWEGNWLAWNTAHDVALLNSKGPKLGFLMYPAAETAEERLDSYSPDAFKYQITAREIKA